MVQLYRVEDTRVRPGGSPRSEERLFYVYQDATGTWRFLENLKPEYDLTTTDAVPVPITKSVPAFTSTCATTGVKFPPTLG